ncbi:MAG: hypothetical protein LBR71_01210, partial [Synergistaceae bacterium]|nr:hypothetical protein [Synergistaceae bacterium]
HRELRFQALSPQNYGSSLGYLTFRQSASFDQDVWGYRESINIPLVVANVYDGPASDAGNELRFDITVLDGEDVVTRKKFLWGADANTTTTQDLGTFFFIQPGADMPVYTLRSRITNRTGTRYRQQRYDAGGTPQQDILPDYWLYDIPPDLYGTLPEGFYLDSQSQIAPGLVTQYSTSMDMARTSSESFRLYPFQGAQLPSDLRLTSKTVRGMTPYGSSLNGQPERGTVPWTASAFRMTFTDVANKDTEVEIEGYAGGRPVMPDSSYAFAGAGDVYINSGALSAFTLAADVPEGLLAASDDVALLPVRARLRVPRGKSLIAGIWNDLENAGLENSESVLDVLARTCAIWVRSPNTMEKDMNLFTANSAPRRCVQAFTYKDFLYIDFIALVADAKSRKSGYSAFCEVVEDDGVPYILLGDGKADGVWTLSFFLDRTGEAPDVDSDETDTDEDSGGGCNAGLFYFALLILPILLRNGAPPHTRAGD